MKNFKKIFLIVLLLNISMCFNIHESYAETTLDCTPTLKRGNKDAKGEENIKNLQKKLNTVMGCKLDTDGSFGAETETCVKSFQKQYSLTKDGKAGKNTCKKLDEVYKKKNTAKEEAKKEPSDLTCSNALKEGSEGKEVEYLQKKLNKVMGCKLDTDGDFGSSTEKCVKSFQKEHSLTVDGKVGKNTCKKINEIYENKTTTKEESKEEPSNLTCSNALKEGSKGKEVEYLQKKLNKVMGCGLDTDGDFGSSTKKCVKSFQKEHSLTVDGSVGRKTCRRLNSEYNEIVSKNNEYVISKGDTKIREKASSSSKKITTVSYGKVFEVYGTSGNWYKIKYNNKYAYINSSEVTKNVIVLDISEQNLKLYKKGKLILDSLVVTGNESKGWKTPTGKYKISYKQKAAKPGSKNNDDRVSLSKYDAYVDYWMPFYKGYGFHDADWRTADSLADGRTYTTNGSHGCVNMLPEDAKILYNKQGLMKHLY